MVNPGKVVLIFLLTVLLHINCDAQCKIQSDRERRALKGDVKSVKNYRTYNYFNRNGYITESYYQNKTTNRYNEKNELIETITTLSPNSSKSEFPKYVYNNCKVFVTTFNENGIITNKATFVYDLQGNRIESYYHDASGKQSLKWIFRYDNDNNIVEWKWYDKKDRLSAISRYEYDSSRLLIKEISKSLIGKTKYITIHGENSKPDEEKIFSEADAPTEITTYKYLQFDLHGNWIKREINDSKIEERQITYYP